MKNKPRLIAFYLPQYHPIPENDKWWGKGFTEWSTVARARPLFRGHYQPRIPRDTGFYDLRLPEARFLQAELARSHGIEGFCYWHYWLGDGKRLLERPFNEVLKSGEPDFPFCLGWANHTWKGVFFGAGGETLIEQKYPGIEDYKAHFDALLPAFLDDRYITVAGKPLFFIYDPMAINDLRMVIETWRGLAHKFGLKGLHIVGGGLPVELAKKYDIDGVANPRHRRIEKLWAKNRHISAFLNLRRRIIRKPLVYEYKKAMKYFLTSGPLLNEEYPVIVPGWDSTPRLGCRGVVLKDSTPELFRTHVREAFQKTAHKTYEDRLIFIKSWNEWAEGMYLEPDVENKDLTLKALRRAID